MTTSTGHMRQHSHSAYAGTWSILEALHLHAVARREATAVVMLDAAGRPVPARALTYGCLIEVAAAAAEHLRSKVEPNDVVILAAPNGPEFVIWFCAGFIAGIRLFPVHPSLTGPELRAAAHQSGASAIIAPNDFVPVADLLIPHIPLSSCSCDATKSWNQLNVNPAILLQSSGTTGLPKIVLRELASLDAVAANTIQATDLASADRVLVAMPLCHSYGVDTLLATLVAGAQLHVAPCFDPIAIAAHLPAVTVFPGVPVMFEALARVAPARGAGDLRLSYSAGTPLPERVFNAFEASWNCRIGQLYGATELGSVTFNHPGSELFDRACVGAPMQGVTVQILDPSDSTRSLPSGEIGQVAIRAPSMLSGYLNEEAPIVDGHLLTGDLGRIDAHGHLSITGRLKLLIDIGGTKVNPMEIEMVLASHEEIAECVVVPLQLSDTVSRLRAVFVSRTHDHTPSVTELRDFLRSRLAPHKIPRIFDCVSSLPRSRSGKILREMTANR